jgi:hypothetical protein
LKASDVSDENKRRTAILIVRVRNILLDLLCARFTRTELVRIINGFVTMSKNRFFRNGREKIFREFRISI